MYRNFPSLKRWCAACLLGGVSILSVPAFATDPLIWLDATSGVTLDNGKVSSWTNLASPGTYDAVQADPDKRPVVLLEEWSGNTLMYFDGVDDLLSLAGTASNAALEDELTVYFVGRRRAGGDFSPGGIVGNYHITNGDGTKGWHMGFLNTGVSQFRVGGATADGGIAELGTDYVIMVGRYKDDGDGTGTAQIYGTLNEDPDTDGASTFQMESSGWDITIGSFVGFKSSGFDRFAEVDVAEIRIYGEALSDVEQQTVYEELATKYSLSAKPFYNIESFSPSGHEASADSDIVITFDVPMDPTSIETIEIGENGLQGLPEQGTWTPVTGTWQASVGDTVFTFTPDTPFNAGSMILVELPDTVVSAEGGFNESGKRLFRSFIVDNGINYPVEITSIDPMAIVDNDGIPHELPMKLYVPDTGAPVPIMFWVHGGSFNGGNSGTLESSREFDGVNAYYYADKMGIAVASVSWRSTNSNGTVAKVNADINTAIQYILDNAATLGIDTTRMGLYGGSAGTPTSSLVAQQRTDMICYIGFNGSYDFTPDSGGYGAGSSGFGQDIPSFEANSALFNIRVNPPKTLLLHGSADTLIGPSQSTKYETALQAAGGEAETLIYESFGHAFYNEGNAMHQPTLYATAKFLSDVFGLGLYGDIAPPPAPANFAATPGNASVALSWDAVVDNDPVTYSVYRSTTSGSYGAALQTAVATNSYSDTTAINGTAYYYTVTAVDIEDNESAMSDEVLAIPAVASNLPPTFNSDPVVEASVVVGQAYTGTLSDDASDPEVDALYFSKVSGPAWLSVASDGSLSGTAPLTSGLNSFSVQVVAAGGSDTATLEITVDPDTTPPPVPTGLAATAGDNSVSLDWTDNGDSDTATYNVYRSTTSASYSTALQTGITSSSYQDNTAVNDTEYFYVVTAVDASSNESANSSEVSATPEFVPDTTPPSAPTGLVANAGDGTVSLSWDANGGGDLASYSVFRSTTSSSYGSALQTGIGTNSYTDSTVTNDVTYFYVVTAVDTSTNESGQSSEASATPAESSATLLADYGFDGSTLASLDSDANSIASDIADGGGLGIAYETRTGRGDPVPCIRWTVGDMNDGTLLDDDYLSFTITPESGYSLDFSKVLFTFKFPASSSVVSVYTSVDGFTGDAVATYNSPGGEIPIVALDISSMAPATGAVEFRLYFDTVATFGGAELWIDNVQLSGTAEVATGIVDGDTDGIDDTWESLYFGSTGSIDGSFDSDGDGVLDFFEYLYGSIPTDSASSGFVFDVGPKDGVPTRVFRWTVNDSFTLGTDYLAWISSDLDSWIEIPAPDYSLNETQDNGKVDLELEVTGDYGSSVFLKLSPPGYQEP